MISARESRIDEGRGARVQLPARSTATMQTSSCCEEKRQTSSTKAGKSCSNARALSDEDGELATRSRRKAPAMIIFWASLINSEFAAALILSIETLDCRVTFRDIAHRNEPKAARLAGFAIHNQFDFRNSAERLKEFPQCAFCHVKGKISDVKLHDDR